MLNGHQSQERKADPAVLARLLHVDRVPPREIADRFGYATENSVHKAVSLLKAKRPVDYMAALGRQARKGDHKDAIHVAALRLLDAGRGVGAVARDLGYANTQALVTAMRRGGQDHADRVSRAMTDACRMPVAEAQVRHRVGLVSLGGAAERRQAQAAAETPVQVLDRLCAALATTEPAVLLLPAAAHALLLGEGTPEAVERHGTTIVRVGYETAVMLQATAEQAVLDRANEARALREKAAALIAKAESLEA